MKKISSRTVCQMALSYDGVTEKDHFGGDAFSANKRMFATVWHENKTVNLRLSPEIQNYFLSKDGEGFLQIENAWGKKGWTKVQLDFIDATLLEKALDEAWKYSSIADKKAKPKNKKVGKTNRKK